MTRDELVKAVQDAIEHGVCCDLAGSEVEFRCPRCREVREFAKGFGKLLDGYVPAAPCDHAKRSHLRPVVLMTWRAGDLVTGVTRSAIVRCYSCGKKWTEEDDANA